MPVGNAHDLAEHIVRLAVGEADVVAVALDIFDAAVLSGEEGA